jgi:phosphate uptake regulator
MLVRKLVQSGPSSFTVALPRAWVRSHRLGKGDLVQLEELPDKIVILPAKLKRQREDIRDIVINVDGKDAHTLHRDTRAAYLAARRITFTGKSLPQKLDQLKKEASELVALEVVDESGSSLVCRNFVNLADVSVANLIRRMDNIVRSMIADMPGALDKPELAQGLRERDYSVNRLGFLVLKCMKSALLDPRVLEDIGLGYVDIALYWELQVQLEKIGDEAKRIARLLSQLGERKGLDRKGLLELCRSAREGYEDVMKSFYTRDAALSDKVAKQRVEVAIACDRYFERHKDAIIAEVTGKLKGLMSHVSDISRLVRYLAI